MKKWLKNLLNWGKNPPPSHFSPPSWSYHATGSIFTSTNPSMPVTPEEIRQAEAQIANFNPVTLGILEEILPEIGRTFGIIFPYKIDAVRQASLGKIINNHVTNALFHKKLQEIIND